MMLQILCIIVVALSIILCYLDLKKKQNFTKKLGNGESDYLPIFGNILSFYPKGFWYIYDWLSSGEPSRLLWIFSVPLFYTRDPEELQKILLNKNSLGKPRFYTFVEPFKKSLISTKVDSWRPHRRLLNKCFKQREILERTPQLKNFSNFVMASLLPKMKAGDLSELLMINVMNGFFGTIGGFGTNDIHSLITVNISKAIATAEVALIKRFVSPWLYPDLFFLRTEYGKLLKKLLEAIRENSMTIMGFMKRRHIMNGVTDKQNFLNMLMENYEPEEIISEMILFIAAGEHTTGTTLAAILLLLGMHQDVQEKVYQEVIEVVGVDGQLETEHLSKLKYTVMVINETLRLFPPVQLVGRQADRDIDLGSNRRISKGTQIIISIKDLHRDENLWKNPLDFIPERFSPEEVEKRHPCCFLPFSFGPRNCIAFKYAEIVMEIYVANIVRNYRISSNCKKVEDIVIPKSMIFQFPENIEVEFEKR